MEREPCGCCDLLDGWRDQEHCAKCQDLHERAKNVEHMLRVANEMKADIAAEHNAHHARQGRVELAVYLAPDPPRNFLRRAQLS